MTSPEPIPSAPAAALPASPDAHPHDARHHDTVTAVRNAILLGGSLLMTYGVSLGIRFVLPRFLGPEVIGRFNFADNFAGTFMVLVSLGLDTYIHREIPVRPHHGDDFFAGTTLIRAAGTALLVLAMAAILFSSGRPLEVHLLVYTFAVYQLLYALSSTLAAFLHASTKVAGLSAVNVWTKVLWGAGTIGALFLGGTWVLLAVALAQLGSEAVKTAAYWRLVRKELNLRWKVEWKIVWTVFVSCLPMFLNGLALAVYGRLGVTLLGFLSSEAEVGYFGQAYGLSMLTLIGTPLIFWVLLPLFSRAAKRSDEELNGHIRRSLELILALAFPASLFLGLAADLWVWLFFGPKFAPSVPSMQLLAPVFTLTYAAVLCAACLMQLKRAWTVTLISLSSLIVSPLCNVLFIPLFARLADGAPGGAATGAGAALLVTESIITILMLFFLRDRAFDRRNVGVVAKSLLICGAVVAADRFLLGYGPARHAATVPLYVVLALATGAVRPREVVKLAKDALKNKRAAAEGTPA